MHLQPQLIEKSKLKELDCIDWDWSQRSLNNRVRVGQHLKTAELCVAGMVGQYLLSEANR